MAMSEARKMEIAQLLSREYGMEGRKKTEESHYDRTTGTLFVGSRVYHTEDLDRARSFMHDCKIRMDEKNDAAYDLYEIAEIAITNLMESSLATGGRMIIKDEQ